jgi:transcriptional regulator with XRE-family HTH domain
VAAEVRAEMARQRMSQQELARRLGVAQQTISRRHTGEVPWDVSELLAVAELLNVPVSLFFA